MKLWKKWQDNLLSFVPILLYNSEILLQNLNRHDVNCGEYAIYIPYFPVGVVWYHIGKIEYKDLISELNFYYKENEDYDEDLDVRFRSPFLQIARKRGLEIDNFG